MKPMPYAEKQDRAAYMREYRARRRDRASSLGGGTFPTTKAAQVKELERIMPPHERLISPYASIPAASVDSSRRVIEGTDGAQAWQSAMMAPPWSRDNAGGLVSGFQPSTSAAFSFAWWVLAAIAGVCVWWGWKQHSSGGEHLAEAARQWAAWHPRL